MNGKDMLESMSFVDEKYVDDAERTPTRRRIRWQPLAAAAACLAVVLGVGAWQLTLPKAAETAQQANEQEIAAYREDAGDAAPLMAGAMVKSAAAPMDMTVRVTARDGLTLTCTVEDADTGGFQPGQTVTVLLPEEAEGIPERIRISYITENEDGTIPALSWEEVVP